MPSFEDLHRLIAGLESGKPISAAARREIASALDYLFIVMLVEEEQHTRGRRRGHAVPFAAAVVKELHDKHGFKIAAAVSAMVRADVGTEDSRRKARQRIEREYGKIKNRPSGQIADRVIQEALLRINPRKTGNK